MSRFDLAFILCCCKAFLGSNEDQDDAENFYTLMGVDPDATQEEIKKAYKRKSLQMHPDKLAQRGQAVTEEDQARFTRMREAYEVLSDEHRRETYDAIGERGMKWINEPFSMDPQDLAHNFARSNALDRSKIFAIFVAIAVAVLILPILICLHADGVFGEDASWTATLTPLWLWNAFILFYHSRVIMMGPIQRPEHIPPEEWVDPLPMKRRYFSLGRFLLVLFFELLVALKLDDVVNVRWSFIFVPYLVWEVSTLHKKSLMARMRIVTVEDLEAAIGKPFSEFTPEERELIAQRYSVVSSTTSPDFEIASRLKLKARQEMTKSCFRIAFVVFLLIQLDSKIPLSWWIVFLPFWIMSFVVCYSNYKSFAEVKQAAAEKDPTLFGLQREDLSNRASPGATANYGTVGSDGAATPDVASASRPNLTEEEREELKAQVMASSSKLCSKCCSQGFLLILLFLFVAKLQGAEFSSLWIISPFLFAASTILCCLGCAIFGITEVSTDGVEFDTGDNRVDATGGGPASAATLGTSYAPPKTDDTFTKNEPDLESGSPTNLDDVLPPPTFPTSETPANDSSSKVDLLDDNAKAKESGGNFDDLD